MNEKAIKYTINAFQLQGVEKEMNISEIATPVLAVDRDAFERNLAVMDGLLAKSPMKLYPHYKSNKCLEIAKTQIARGAGGITCAKVSEAEDLAEGGVKTIVLANQVVQPEKMTRVAALARRADVTVCVDDARNVAGIESAALAAGSRLRVLVEFEVGLNRCGVETEEEVIALARAVASCRHLSFDGIQAYAGQLSHETDAAKRRAAVLDTEARVRRLKAAVEAAGFPCRNVAGASTGTVADKPLDTPYTQLQAGSYVFMDSTYAELGLPFEQSLYVLTRVLSVRPGRVVLDGGVKSFTMDQHPPTLPDLPGVKFELNEEHTILFGDGLGLKPNDIVRIVPGHCCTTVNCNDWLYVMDGGAFGDRTMRRGECGKVIDRWRITSRGKSQ